MIEKDTVTFPCAQCCKDADAAKLKKGPDFVFCRASCARAFNREHPRALLHHFHRMAVKATNTAAARRRPTYSPRVKLSDNPGPAQRIYDNDSARRLALDLPPRRMAEFWETQFSIMKEMIFANPWPANAGPNLNL